jgi:hypothetical protein
VLDVVAPPSSSRLYAVNKVPQHDFQDPFEMSAAGIYTVFAFAQVRRRVTRPKGCNRASCGAPGGTQAIGYVYNILLLTCKEYDDLSSEHCYQQA